MTELVHGVEISRELRERARNPVIRSGAGCLAAELASVPQPLAVLTQPEVWSSVPEAARAHAAHVTFVRSLDRGELDAVERALPAVAAVAGIGGGVVVDNAKWVAWRRGIPYFPAPSSVSVDAFVSNTIAVREASRVVYEGFVAPERVIVDPTLIATAPPRFNRAGVGDLLSIHTALWDWERGVAHGGAPVVHDIAARAARILERVDELADALGATSPDALVFIAESYAAVNGLIVEAGHSQPEEGSEHYLAYALEEETGRSFVHGEIVGLGVVVMATLQANRPERARSILARCRVEWQPRALGIARAAFVRALSGLPRFVEKTRAPWSVANQAALSRDAVEALLAGPLADLAFADTEPGAP